MTNIIKFASREYRRGARNVREELADGTPLSELMGALTVMYVGDDYDRGYFDELCAASERVG